MNKTEIAKAKKEELVLFLKEKNANLTGNENRQELVEMAMLAVEMDKTSNTSTSNTSPVVNTPTPLQKEWTDYVLSLLWETEIVNKKNGDKFDRYPKADGLRRVFELLIGPILEVSREIVQAPIYNRESDSGLTVATVKVHIRYLDNMGTPKIFEEVADCYEGNTIDPYYRHPSGTASTMAEGRALRKILHLKALTIEEMRAEKVDGGQIDDVEPIKENQKNVIKMLCVKLDTNVDEIVKTVFGDKKKKENLTFQDGATLIQHLNNLQQKGK